MASGDSFSRASVARPREGGHSQSRVCLGARMRALTRLNSGLGLLLGVSRLDEFESKSILDSKNPSQYQSDQRHVRTHFRGKPHEPGDLSRAPFLTELPGPAPLTSRRPPKTGLQTPRDHQSRGTSFRRPSRTRLGFPRGVSAVTNVSRRALGTLPRKTENTTISEHLTTIPEHRETSREH
ncbi:hypothetical protein CRG98_023367 [Punica granatum]|uniref:Uncharacterized protein n=1 Tax=Punica granatum TaxID=22663 RepID=A0A2I0JL10_PUNGR|nr:hypothetical protein CRG98_023367 [Punica granatum]